MAKEKKNNSTEEKIKELTKQLNEYQDKNLHLLAEMENLRKRVIQEKEENVKYRASGFILDILPTVDMLESALKAKEVSDEVKNWLIGFEMISSNFQNSLLNEGVEKIEVKKGDTFNHNWHQAIEEIETKEVKSGKIVEMKLPGYKLKGRLLRPTTVVIAKKAEKNKKELLN